MLDFRVRTFLKVCETLNYTRAAEELHITQPAVSQHIRFLEHHYGVKLFDYAEKRLTLTPAGRQLAERLLVMSNDERLLVKEVEDSSRHRQRVSFGVTMTIGEYGLVMAVAAYMERHPETDLQICYANTAELLARLESGQISFALVEGYYPTERFEHLNCSTEDFIPVCSSRHHFAGEVKELRDLTGERLLLREEGSGTRKIMERALAVRGLDIRNFSHYAEIGSMHTIISLLRQDLGISFLYRVAVEEDLRQGTLRELKLKDFAVRHDFDFIWEKHSLFRAERIEVCAELRDYYHATMREKKDGYR